VATVGQILLDSLLHAGQAQLLQAGDFGLGEGLVREV
jgi:hypothetical protein